MRFSLPDVGAPVPSQAIKVEEKTHASKLIYQVQPEYPQEAKRLGIEGEVMLYITVDKGGAVIDARPISGHELLTDAAIQAVRQWKYSPTSLSGDLAKVESTVTIVFKLS